MQINDENKPDEIISELKKYLNIQQNDTSQIISILDNIKSSDNGYIYSRILKSALLIKDGKLDSAKEIVENGLTMQSDDAEIHYHWGILCEMLELYEQAKSEYSNSLRLDSNHKDSAYALGLLYFRDGDLEKAIRYLQRTLEIDPDFAEAYYLLGTALESRGLSGVAKKAFARAKELDPTCQQTPIDEHKPEAMLSHSSSDLALISKLFSGREGVHARQWMSPDGKSGYTPVSQPLLERHIETHLNGSDTLGIYFVRNDNTVKLGVIDIDITKSALAEAGNDDNAIAKLNKLVEQDSLKLLQVFKKLNIPVYIEYSGWKGRHCWIFLDKPIRAGIVKNFLKEICNSAGESPQGINREIFPKQESVSETGFGSLVKLPLGIHKVTGRRCLFLDESGKPFEDQFSLLRRIELVSEESLRSTTTNLKPKPETEYKDTDDSTINLITQKCNVIRHLSEKVKNSAHLTHDERVVLLYTLGHIGDAGKQYIHVIIGQCSDYDYHFTEKSIQGLKANPISCPRIRDRLPDVTSNVVCDCQFPLLEGSYPTPVRHVDPSFVAKFSDNERQRSEMTPSLYKKEKDTATQIGKSKIDKDRPTLDEVLRQYMELKKSLLELDQKFKQKEEELTSLFESTGAERVRTLLGELSREIKDGRYIWKINI